MNAVNNGDQMSWGYDCGMIFAKNNPFVHIQMQHIHRTACSIIQVYDIYNIYHTSYRLIYIDIP